ncbi:MAG: FAD-binding oxidoreductase [Elusimicrobia bacterium CG_4_9_14_3_um_filter_62_55]|nr:MAG: FAD-binding oxidoreductase [Elusimicrobia bacterium CG_4_10_14_0_2_um_filter_63_34]PJB26707.1 MAG: FAD-binding oxidoreductase [Elusimicrobia bacterium CG_4_9_14_3_um_filter_62_55]
MIEFHTLRERLRGELYTGEAELLTYAYDAALDRSRPDAVVVARSAEDVRRTVAWCAERKVPFVARGAGTNLSGGCVPLRGGVVVSLAKLDKIVSIDTEKREAVVEPGVVNLHLQNALAPLGFFYAPDPASFKVCTLGGNIGENAGGPRCLKYGTTTHHILGLDVVLPDGSLERFSLEDRGPQLASLITGAEGTLGIVTRARVKILPLPESITTILASFDSIDAAMGCVSDMIAAGVVPRVLEAMDRMTIDSIEAYLPCGLPSAEAVLLIEVEGSKRQIERELEKVSKLCEARGSGDLRLATDPAKREKLWEGRRSAYAALARLAPNVLVEDGVVPRDKLPEAARRIKEIAKRHSIEPALLFHAGDGNLHPNVIFDERDAEWTRRVKAGGFEILKMCVELGGSISGEHGIGIDKRRAMAWLFSEETLALFRRIKRAFDPRDLANPDKLFPLEGEPPPEGLIRPAPPAPSDAQNAFVERVREKAARGEALTVIGSGTKCPKNLRGRGEVLSTKVLDRIVALDRGNFIVTVESGVAVRALKAELEAEGFFVPIPLTLGTVGGLLATCPWLPLREAVLAMKLLLPTGEVVEVGSKVVKSVAGYDVAKLLLGSWGTLAIILEVTLKLLAARPDIPNEFPIPPKPTPGPVFARLQNAFDPHRLLNGWILEDSDA